MTVNSLSSVGNFKVENIQSLGELNLNALTSVGNMEIRDNDNLDRFVVNDLTTADTISMWGNDELESLSFQQLESVGFEFNIDNHLKLEFLNMPRVSFQNI